LQLLQIPISVKKGSKFSHLRKHRKTFSSFAELGMIAELFFYLCSVENKNRHYKKTKPRPKSNNPIII